MTRRLAAACPRVNALVGLLAISPVALGQGGEQIAPLGVQQALSVTTGLVVVLVVIGVVAWLGKKVMRFTPAGVGPLKIISGLSLGARDKIVLVQVGEEQLLVGVSPGRIQTLHVLRQNVPESSESPRSAGGFAEHMKQALSSRGVRGKP